MIPSLILKVLVFLVISGISCNGWLGGTNSTDDLFIHFINVGYGDSILVELPDGRNILIDGGDREGGAKVVEYLKRRNIEKLDMVIITHPHHDHLEGLFSVIKNYEIDIIIANEDISESKNYSLLFEVAKGQEIKSKQVKRGDIIDRFEGGRVEILHPDKLTGNWNNDSLVMKLTYKKVSFLFTADIGQEICDVLVEYYGEKLRSNVLKVPYHGKSGTEKFIRKVSPELAVVSVGPSKWGGPWQEILAEYKNLKIPLLRTDEETTIVVRTEGKRIWF